MIHQDTIKNQQNLWANGVIELGQLKGQPEESKAYAKKFVEEHYSFDEKGVCLFKPTKAKEIPFRMNVDGVLSYFIGGNSNYPEDTGFAFHQWDRIDFDNAGCLISDNTALVMGHYYFHHKSNAPLKVEYTFSYVIRNNTMKLNLHHSSLPYSG